MSLNVRQIINFIKRANELNWHRNEVNMSKKRISIRFSANECDILHLQRYSGYQDLSDHINNLPINDYRNLDGLLNSEELTMIMQDYKQRTTGDTSCLFCNNGALFLDEKTISSLTKYGKLSNILKKVLFITSNYSVPAWNKLSKRIPKNSVDNALAATCVPDLSDVLSKPKLFPFNVTLTKSLVLRYSERSISQTFRMLFSCMSSVELINKCPNRPTKHEEERNQEVKIFLSQRETERMDYILKELNRAIPYKQAHFKRHHIVEEVLNYEK